MPSEAERHEAWEAAAEAAPRIAEARRTALARDTDAEIMALTQTAHVPRKPRRKNADLNLWTLAVLLGVLVGFCLGVAVAL